MANRQAESDSELVKLASGGDGQAFGQLYERHFDDIYRFFLYRTRQFGDAEDLAGQTFLRAWEYLTGGKAERIRNFRGWLFRVGRNLLVDFYRKRQPETQNQDFDRREGSAPGPAESYARQEAENTLMKGLAQLDGKLQDVLVCRMVSGLSHKETALALNLKEGHVRVLQHRALKQLRRFMDEEGLE